MNWQPIATAPKDGSIVRLRDAQGQYNCVMYWDKREKLWVGTSYGMLGSSRTYWDEDFCAIAEWSEVLP